VSDTTSIDAGIKPRLFAIGASAGGPERTRQLLAAFRKEVPRSDRQSFSTVTKSSRSAWLSG